MLNTLSHKRNANQNDTEISCHPSQNGNHQEHHQQMLARMQGKMNPYSLLLGM
jgi:hypothetical protein